MASKSTKFTVGLFVAAGIVVALMAVIWLGMSRYLREGHFYVTYFNESVQGLDQDSPVKYRGVSVGRVASIDVAPDSKLIEVVLKIETGQSLEQDIMAQLKSVGITGSVFIELDRRRPDEPDESPALSFPSEYPVVASKPSEISELLRGVDDALNQIRSLDLEGISEKVKETLDHIGQTVSDARVGQLSAQLELSLKGLAAVLKEERWEKVGRSVEDVAQSADEFLVRARKSLAGLESALTRVDRLTRDVSDPIKRTARNLEQASKGANQLFQKGGALAERTDQSVVEIRNNLLRVLKNLELATQNLNRVIDSVGEQPSRILFRDPPAPRRVERDR